MTMRRPFRSVCSPFVVLLAMAESTRPAAALENVSVETGVSMHDTEKVGGVASVATPNATAAAGSARLRTVKHARVAFRKLGAHYLQAGKWNVTGITAAQIDSAEQLALSSSNWTVAGGWRAKWQNGSLWVRMLSIQPHWAERASVLHLLLTATSQLPQLPPFDVVYVHNDRDPSPKLQKVPARSARRRNWPVLTNAHEPGTRL